MKVYKTNMVTLKVASCKECPNRKKQDEFAPSFFPRGMVCSAIDRVIEDPDDPFDKMPYHPPISEAKYYGGILKDCPLPDAQEV